MEHEAEVTAIVELFESWFDEVTTGSRLEVDDALTVVKAALRLAYACGDLHKWPPELRQRYIEFAQYDADFKASEWYEMRRKG